MVYILKIGDYLEILTDDEVKDFVVINFEGFFKPSREKLYSNLSEKKDLRKVTESLYIFLATPDEVIKHVAMVQSSFSDICLPFFSDIYLVFVYFVNLFDPVLQLINIKPIIKNKLKELLTELKSLMFIQY